MRRSWWMVGVAGLAIAIAAAAEVNQDWLQHVPAKERARVNPYAGNATAIAAGARLFQDHCASCHGSDLRGTPGKPSLRTSVVEQATDGELFWLLKNGDLRHGMPSWSSVPEPERWQIVAFVKAQDPGRR
jgi:mono/diheme cytochrome c family protein